MILQAYEKMVDTIKEYIDNISFENCIVMDDILIKGVDFMCHRSLRHACIKVYNTKNNNRKDIIVELYIRFSGVVEVAINRDTFFSINIGVDSFNRLKDKIKNKYAETIMEIS